MECSSCGHVNRQEAKFCEECGRPATTTCNSCDTELRTAAKFCDQCGTPVESSSAAPDLSVDVAAVRKTVTVLFCDVVGSTAFAERVDAETARDTMARYHAMARTTIEAHRGAVAKYIGDGVMAIWGTPEVSPDDAERAVAAGVELQAGFEPIGASTADRYGIELGLRVGINTGEVVIASDDADVVGDALNTAARLEAACSPGEVVVGESTWRLTRTGVDYRPLAPVAVKGKAEPVATFLVTSGYRGEPEPNSAPRFIGRSAELASLRADFDASRTDRSVLLTTVIGAPGVGKTRLAAELVASLRSSGTEITAFELRCEEVTRSAFGPVRDLLLAAITDNSRADDATIGELEGGGPDAVLAAINRLIDPSTPDKERLVELLGSVVGVGDARSTEESFFAVRRFLAELAARRPVVVVVDDIQWAEPLLLDLLEHLAEWGSGGAVLVVGLARPELRTIRPALTEEGRRVNTVINLEGLVPADTEKLAAELLGVDHLPGELVSRLPASTEGNPLFVRELVRMLADDGVIAPAGDTFDLTIDPDAVQVPPTIQSLLATRVERLPEDERRVLELAAVVGPEFPRGAVATLARPMPAAELDSILERLRRRDLIDPVGTYWGDEPVLRFHHALIRDAAYRRLLKANRANLHLAVAHWTRDKADAMVGHHETAVAVHYEQAYHYRSELGPVDDETVAIGVEAAELLTAAAIRSLAVDDLGTTGSLSQRALATIGPGDQRRPGLLLIACEALASSGAIDAAQDQVAALRAGADNERLEGWVTCFESQLRLLTDSAAPTPVAEATEGAAQSLARLGDEAGVAKARQVRASALARLGRIGECEAELDLALAAARAAEDGRRVSAVLGAAPLAALWGPSTVPRAGGRCLDVVRLLRITNGSPAVEVVSIRCQAVLEALRGRTDEARGLLAQARATAEELGLRQSFYETEFYAGFVELLDDEPAAAEPHLRAARSGLGQLGIGADAGQASAYLARSLLRQGRLDEAETLATEAVEQAGQNLQTVIAAGAVAAEIRAASGDLDTALESVKAAVATAAGTDVVVDHALASAALARVNEAAGDDDAAADAWADVSSLALAKDAPALSPAPLEAPDGPAPRASLAGLAAPMRMAIERTIEAFARRDVDQLSELFGPGFTVDDRRVGVTLERDRGSHIAAISAMFAEASGIDLRPSVRVVDAPSDRTVLAEVTITRARDAVTDALMIARLGDDGRFERHVIFEPDQLELARAELGYLGMPEVMSQPMARAWSDIYEAYRLRDIDRFARWLHPDFVFDDRRSGLTLERDRAAHLAAVQALLAEHGRLIATIEAVAERGQHLLLCRATILRGNDARTDFLLIASIRPRESSGQFDRYVVFDPDDREAALAELDRRARIQGITAQADIVAGQPMNRAIEIGVRQYQAYSSEEYDHAFALFSPDLVRYDRRAGFSLAPANRAEYVESMRAFFDLGGRFSRPRYTEVRGENLALGVLDLEYGAENRAGVVAVHRIDEHGLVNLIVAFNEDQYDEALAELDRLHTAARRVETAGGGNENTAATTFRALIARARPDDLSVYEEMVSPSIVREDRRRGVADGVLVGRDAMVEMSSAVFSTGFRYIEPVVIEQRGDHLALVRSGMTNAVGDRVVILSVNRVDAQGQLDRFVFFDEDDLGPALNELDQLAVTAGTRATLVAAELFDWLGEGDADRALAMAADDLRQEDFRVGFSFGVVDRTQLTELARQAVASDDGLVRFDVETIATAGDDVVLNHVTITRPDGYVTEMLHLTQIDEHDLIRRIVLLSPDDETRARVELQQRAGRGPNRAALVVDELLRRTNEVAETVSPDEVNQLFDATVALGMEREDRRPGLGFGATDRDGFLIAMRAFIDLGGRQENVRHVAWRGEDLVLSRYDHYYGPDNRSEMLIINRFTSSDQLVRTVVFDPSQEAEALAELDRLNALSGSGPVV